MKEKSGMDLKIELKNIVIRPLAKPPALRPTFFDESWKVLGEALEEILLSKPSSKSTEYLYRLVCDLITAHMGERLYENLLAVWKEKVVLKVKQIHASCDIADQDFLTLIDNFWSEYKNQVGKLRQIFLTLERAYMIRSSNYKSIWKFCMGILEQAIQQKGKILARIVNSTFSMIMEERMKGTTIKLRCILRSATEILIELGQYQGEFEDKFIAHTKLFYDEESLKKLEANDIKLYLNYIQQRIKEEGERVNVYMDLNTGPSLQDALEQTLINAHISKLLGEGFLQLLDEGAETELSSLYEAIKRVNQYEALQKAWYEYVWQRGKLKLEERKSPGIIINDLINFKLKSDSILENSFEGNISIKMTLKWVLFYEFCQSYLI